MTVTHAERSIDDYDFLILTKADGTSFALARDSDHEDFHQVGAMTSSRFFPSSLPIYKNIFIILSDRTKTCGVGIGPLSDFS